MGYDFLAHCEQLFEVEEDAVKRSFIIELVTEKRLISWDDMSYRLEVPVL